MVRTNRLIRASEGMAGGGAGALSANVLNPDRDDREVLPNSAHMHLHVTPGDVIHHVIAGSGGHGSAWERDPERVLEDVLDEKVSVGAANRQYGVVIDPESLTIDIDATRSLRTNATVTDSSD